MPQSRHLLRNLARGHTLLHHKPRGVCLSPKGPSCAEEPENTYVSLPAQDIQWVLWVRVLTPLCAWCASSAAEGMGWDRVQQSVCELASVLTHSRTLIVSQP